VLRRANPRPRLDWADRCGGVIVRVRAKKKSGDVTIKLRDPDGGIDVRAWRAGAGNSSDAKIECDWAGKRLVSASLGHDLDEDAVREVDATQRLQQRATDGGLDITAAGQETKMTTVLRHLTTRHTNAPPA
jgi:hypothetical protein